MTKDDALKLATYHVGFEWAERLLNLQEEARLNLAMALTHGVNFADYSNFGISHGGWVRVNATAKLADLPLPPDLAP